MEATLDKVYFELIYIFIRRYITNRSLFFLFTNVESSYGLQRILPVLRMLNKLHLLVVVLFENDELKKFADSNIESIEGIYTTAIAEKMINEKRQLSNILKQHGIQTVLTTPEKLTVSTVKKQLDIDFLHQFLTNVYWAKGRSVAEIKKCIRHSLNFGVYLNGKQIGYARVVTDYVVFAYLLDVFIDEKYRGRGYSRVLMENILINARLRTIKIWRLGTDDAQGLYARFGFKAAKHPEKLMELFT